MTLVAVLDAAAFDVIDRPDGAHLRALLRAVLQRGGDVRCSAVTLAEVCRGPERAYRAELATRKSRGGQRVMVVPADERTAKLVGAILHASGAGREAVPAAHVVAVAAGADFAVVVTADPGTVEQLARAVPGTRVVARAPDELTVLHREPAVEGSEA